METTDLDPPIWEAWFSFLKKESPAERYRGALDPPRWRGGWRFIDPALGVGCSSGGEDHACAIVDDIVFPRISNFKLMVKSNLQNK